MQQKEAVAKHIHEAADGAGVADGEHLDHGQHQGDGGGGQGAEEEAADGDGGGLHIQLEEAVHLGRILLRSMVT